VLPDRSSHDGLFPLLHDGQQFVVQLHPDNLTMLFQCSSAGESSEKCRFFIRLKGSSICLIVSPCRSPERHDLLVYCDGGLVVLVALEGAVAIPRLAQLVEAPEVRDSLSFYVCLLFLGRK
jgi:hypothetical protein